MKKTYVAKPNEVERKWWIIDAEDVVLGRLATQVATLLRGKHKPQYTPHEDTGDFVVIINAEKIRVTGKKPTQKFYRRHSGYPGGFKEESFKALIARRPEKVLEEAIRGMIPHSRLGRRQFTKLNVYAGSAHPHQAQKAQVFELKQEASA